MGRTWSKHEYHGPARVTAAYFAIYYAFILYGAVTKMRLSREFERRGEEFDRYFGQDRKMLFAARVCGNTLEHMCPFLFSMWLHAIYVSPETAAQLGWLYVALRAKYPLFLAGGRFARQPAMGLRRNQLVLFSTYPQYAICAYFLISTLWSLRHRGYMSP